MNSPTRYKSAWWSITVPDHWTVKNHPECTTFTNGAFPGALQISAMRKDSGDISLEEITELAANDEMSRCRLRRIVQGEFEGFYVATSDGDHLMREWWLAKQNLLVYVTFCVDAARKDEERVLIDDVVASLQAQ